MSSVSFSSDVSSVIPPNRLFKAFLLDSDNLIPKIMPQAIQKVEKREGDGGPGTIKIVTFGEGSPIKSATHRVDEVDEANHVYKYTVIDGDGFMGVLEFISYDVKIEAGPDGGSVCKTTSTYHAKTEDHGITEDKVKMGKDKGEEMFRAIEAYLLAHPDEYN